MIARITVVLGSRKLIPEDSVLRMSMHFVEISTFLYASATDSLVLLPIARL